MGELAGGGAMLGYVIHRKDETASRNGRTWGGYKQEGGSGS